MALGWKVLIPVSLLWVMVAATIRSLSTAGLTHPTAVLVAAGVAVAAAC
ncbi:hypothetical protein I552_2932 [Mycobacterium xenopi 3993]|nr:hypothetical protein I552_2932 [Mycobacterium xenopi 3993]